MSKEKHIGDCKNCNDHKEKQIEEMVKIASKCMTKWLNNETPKVLPNYIAESIYNAGYRKQEWISVDERLPEGKVNCLVHCKHAYCDNDGYWNIGVSFYDGHEFHIGLAYKVTHWMPLPEAPKMKGGAE